MRTGRCCLGRGRVIILTQLYNDSGINCSSGAKAVKQEVPDGARDCRRQRALPAVHDACQGDGGGWRSLQVKITHSVHHYDLLQAIVLPRRGSRSGRAASPLLPRPHWLPSQWLLWTQWGGCHKYATSYGLIYPDADVSFLVGVERLDGILNAQPNGRLLNQWDLPRRRKTQEHGRLPITFTLSETSLERSLLRGLRMYLCWILNIDTALLSEPVKRTRKSRKGVSSPFFYFGLTCCLSLSARQVTC